jgi:hypothetical protein
MISSVHCKLDIGKLPLLLMIQQLRMQLSYTYMCALGCVWFRSLQSGAALFQILRMKQLYSVFGRRVETEQSGFASYLIEE